MLNKIYIQLKHTTLFYCGVIDTLEQFDFSSRIKVVALNIICCLFRCFSIDEILH